MPSAIQLNLKLFVFPAHSCLDLQATAALDYYVIIQPESWTYSLPGQAPAIALARARELLKDAWGRFQEDVLSVVSLRLEQGNVELSPIQPSGAANDIQPYQWTQEQTAQFWELLKNCQIGPDAPTAEKEGDAVPPIVPVSLPAALESSNVYVQVLRPEKSPATAPSDNDGDNGHREFSLNGAALKRQPLVQAAVRAAQQPADAPPPGTPEPTPIDSVAQSLRKMASFFTHNRPERELLGFCRRIRVPLPEPWVNSRTYMYRAELKPYPSDSISLSIATSAIAAELSLNSAGLRVHCLADEAPNMAGSSADASLPKRVPLHRGVAPMENWFAALTDTTRSLHLNLLGPGDDLELVDHGESGIQIVRLNPKAGAGLLPNAVELGAYPLPDRLQVSALPELANGWTLDVRPVGASQWSCLLEQSYQREQRRDAPPYIVPATRGHHPFDLKDFGYVALSWVSSSAGIDRSAVLVEARRSLIYWYVLRTPAGEFLHRSPELALEEPWPQQTKSAQEYEMLSALLQPGNWLYARVTDKNRPLASEGFLGIYNSGTLNAFYGIERSAILSRAMTVKFDAGDVPAEGAAVVVQGSWQLDGDAEPYRPELATFTSAESPLSITVAPNDWPNDVLVLACLSPINVRLRDQSPLGIHQLGAAGRPVTLRLYYDNGQIAGAAERGTRVVGSMRKNAGGSLIFKFGASPDYEVEWADDAVLSDVLLEWFRVRPRSSLARDLMEKSIDLAVETPVRVEGVETSAIGAARRIRVHRAEFYPEAQLGVLRSVIGSQAFFVPYRIGPLGWPEKDDKAPPVTIDVSEPLKQKLWLQDGLPVGQLIRAEWSSLAEAKVIVLANDWMAGRVLTGGPYAAGPKDGQYYIEVETPSGGPKRFDVPDRILNATSFGGWLLFAQFALAKSSTELSAALFKARLWWRGERDAASAVFYDSAGRAIPIALTTTAVLPRGGSSGDHGYYDVSYTVTAQRGAVLDLARPLRDAAVPGLFRSTSGVWSQLLVTPVQSSFVRASRGFDDRIVRVGDGLLNYVKQQAAANAPAPLWIQVKSPTWAFQAASHRPVDRVLRRTGGSAGPMWRCQTVEGQSFVFIPGARLVAVQCTLQSGPPEDDDKPEWKDARAIVLLVDYDTAKTKLLTNPADPLQPVLAKRFDVTLRNWHKGTQIQADEISNVADAPLRISLPPTADKGIVATGILCEWAGTSFIREADESELSQYSPIWKAMPPFRSDITLRYGMSYEFRLRLVDPAGQARQDTVERSSDYLRHLFRRSARIATPRIALVATTQSPPPKEKETPQETAPVIPASSHDTICAENEWPELPREGMAKSSSVVYQSDEGRRVIIALGIRTTDVWQLTLLPPSTGYEICERAGAFDKEDVLPTERVILYKRLRDEGLLGRNSQVRRSPDAKDSETKPTTPVFSEGELRYLPDPFVRGVRLRVRYVGENFESLPETTVEALWWTKPPSEWGLPQLRHPEKIRVEIKSGRQLHLAPPDGNQIVLTLPPGRRAMIGVAPLFFENQAQAAIKKTTIEVARALEAERMIYHAVSAPNRPKPDTLKVKRLDPLREMEKSVLANDRLPPRVAGNLRVECSGRVDPETTGRLMIEWAKEIWVDDPELPLPIVPAAQLDQYLDPFRLLTMNSAGRAWSDWIDLIAPSVSQGELVSEGLPEHAIAYLKARIAESREGVFHAAIESNVLRDGGLGAEVDERGRSALQTLTGRYDLGGRGVIFGRHRLVGWTRFEVAEPQSSPVELQKEEDGYRLLQLNHDRLEKPIVAYMIPLIYEECNHPQQLRYTSKISNAGYRIFFNRPWFISGAGELVAVLFAKAGEQLERSTHWAIDPIWAATTPKHKGGEAVRWAELTEQSLLAQTPRAHQGAYSDIEAMAVGLKNFERKLETLSSGMAWRLKDLWATAYGSAYDPAIEPSGVAYSVAFSVERGLWYIDVPLPPPIMFGMFVQLVLARVQPLSSIGPSRDEKGRFISDPIVLHYCSLAPDRSVEIARDISGWDHTVTLHGFFPDNDAKLPFSNEVWLSIEVQLLQYAVESDPVSFVQCHLEESAPGVGRAGAPIDGRQNKTERVRLKWDAGNRCYSGRLELQPAFFAGKKHGLHSPSAQIVLEEIVSGESGSPRPTELGSPTPLIISATRVQIEVE